MARRTYNPLPGTLVIEGAFLVFVDGILFNATYLSECPLQIENEFGPLEWDQGEPAKAYASWAANMAVALNTGVPWIMCKEDDAPDPIVCTVPLLFNTEYMYWGKQFLVSLMFFVTVVQERKGYDRSYIEFPLF